MLTVVYELIAAAVDVCAWLPARRVDLAAFEVEIGFCCNSNLYTWEWPIYRDRITNYFGTSKLHRMCYTVLLVFLPLRHNVLRQPEAI